MPYANEWESWSDTTIPVLILKPGIIRQNHADVGGGGGRKIVFYTHTGQVIVKPLRNTYGRSLPAIREDDELIPDS